MELTYLTKGNSECKSEGEVFATYTPPLTDTSNQGQRARYHSNGKGYVGNLCHLIVRDVSRTFWSLPKDSV